MAYTPIDKGGNFFNTKLYTGNGGTNALTGVGFQPDLTWLKVRLAGSGQDHTWYDAVRGATKFIESNTTNAEATGSNYLTSFNSDGFTLGNDQSHVNASGDSYASWNWIGANPPKKTYIVKVVSDGGNKYRLDDFAANAVTLELSEGGTFIFDQSDSSNNGHPLRFSTTSNGTHAGGSIYTTGVVVSGTPGQAGAKTTITVAASAPTLYYFCTVHSGMGGQANTPTTNSFTNLAGSLQSNVSPNTISRFSIVSFTGSGANATVGHGLGFVPKMIIVKARGQASTWSVYHASLGATKFLRLNDTNAVGTEAGWWNNTEPTASVFSIGTNHYGNTQIAYCFGDVQGFSKFGSYTGNGNADGTFVYTGFKPAFVLQKRTDAVYDWQLHDNKRSSSGGNNLVNSRLEPNATNVESTDNIGYDFLSNGFKTRTNNANYNASGGTYIYMAFAEHPFTSSAGTPVTAR